MAMQHRSWSGLLAFSLIVWTVWSFLKSNKWERKMGEEKANKNRFCQNRKLNCVKTASDAWRESLKRDTSAWCKKNWNLFSFWETLVRAWCRKSKNWKRFLLHGSAWQIQADVLTWQFRRFSTNKNKRWSLTNITFSEWWCFKAKLHSPLDSKQTHPHKS